MGRDAECQAFLDNAGWADATRRPLAGDASARRYERLSLGGKTAVLMDAAPAAGQDVRPFLRIGAYLAGLGLSPPAILAADEARGFLLLEDLGDDLIARLVAADPAREPALYAAAVDLLLDLHRHPAPEVLPALGPEQLADMLEPLWSWYLPGCGAEGTPGFADDLHGAMLAQLRALAPAPDVIALRDFHAENLLWLPDRAGPARVGLLDFQDAFAGHPAYDLVSLLEDARRDVAPGLRDVMIARYVTASGVDPDDFGRACAALAAQRNMRILGVFARLSLHFGKPHYVALIPRVWGLLQADLAHPALRDLANLVQSHVPAPTADRLNRLRELCGTCPTP